MTGHFNNFNHIFSFKDECNSFKYNLYFNNVLIPFYFFWGGEGGNKVKELYVYRTSNTIMIEVSYLKLLFPFKKQYLYVQIWILFHF